MISNFRSPDHFSAFWQYNDGSYSNICATQGRSFLNRVKLALGLPAGGSWDQTLQSRLISTVQSYVSQDPAWSSIVSALQADLAARTPSRVSVQTAIYITYYRGNNRRFDAITVPVDAILPQWNIAPPDDRNYNQGQLVCYDPSIDEDPGILAPQQLSAATNNSVSGVRREPGRGQSSMGDVTQQQTNGVVSPLTVAGISLLILGAGILLFRGKK